MPDTPTPTFWQLVDARATAAPHEVVVSDDGGDEATGASLRERAETTARRLAALGVEPGDCVSWLLPSSVEAAVLVAALARLGATQNPIIPIHGRPQIAFITRQAGSRVLVTPEEFRGIAFGETGRAVAADVGLTWTSMESLPEAAGVELPDAPADPQPARWLFYTSGTTGEPKGVRHSDRTMVLAGRALARAGLHAGSRWGGAVPITHVGVPSILTRALEVGLRMHFIRVFDPAATCEELREQRIDVVAGVGALVSALLDDQAGHDSPRFPDLRTLVSGGGPKLPGLAHRTRDELGAALAPSYGMTECPFITAASPDDPIEALEAAEGAATPGVEIRILEADGSDAGAGEEGEIRVRAPQQFLGYVDSALDSSALDEQGFIRTGDLGYLRPDGHLVISGRLKEVVVRNGENLATREIEDLLLRHPLLADASVIGLPDHRTGEQVCAVVVPRQGATVELDDVRSFCHEHDLMRQKLPERLVVVDALPRNPMGKVLKPELRAQVLGGG